MNDKACPGTTTTSFASALSMRGIIHQITVEALVEAQRPGGEAMQALVSQWMLSEDFGTFDVFDAAGTDGLDSTGYFGAVFDGRYIYFVPEMHADLRTHAVVLRYDTHGSFHDRASYRAFDAGNITGLEARGFYGAAFDGRYVYFVPRQFDCTQYHSRVLRLDTHQPFDNAAAWAVCDAGHANSQQGAAFDGRYLYFCPGFEGDPNLEDRRSGRVIRLDTEAPFAPAACAASVDLMRMLGPEAACFDGGAFDGRYIYFVPIETQHVVRYDTTGTFDSRASWQIFDAQCLGIGTCVGAVFDGRFLYFVPYGHGTVVCYETTEPFVNMSSWSRFEAQRVWPDVPLGFDGGFFDGRYVYFIPFIAGASKQEIVFHGHLLRYDTRASFTSVKGWQFTDAARTAGQMTVGYNAGAFDGRYFYAAPWQAGINPRTGKRDVHARILRYDSLGHGGSFSLRYCDYGHNGGLCAAVPGPSFVINTAGGALSVASHRMLGPGVHHLAGVYDGNTLQLYIDGELAARRQARGGPLVASEVPISVGEFAGGDARFHGCVLHARIHATASTAQSVAGLYRTAMARIRDSSGSSVE